MNVKFEGQKEAVFKNVGYGAAAGFNDVDPTSAVIVFDRDDPRETVLRMQRLGLEAGRSYTIVRSGATTRQLKPITVTVHAFPQTTP